MFHIVSSKMPLSRQVVSGLEISHWLMAVAKARPSAGLRMSTFRHSEEIMNKSFGVLTLCFN